MAQQQPPGPPNPAQIYEDYFIAGGFSAWALSGVTRGSDGALRIDLASAASETDPYPAGGYQGHNYYNGGS